MVNNKKCLFVDDDKILFQNNFTLFSTLFLFFPLCKIRYYSASYSINIFGSRDIQNVLTYKVLIYHCLAKLIKAKNSFFVTCICGQSLLNKLKSINQYNFLKYAYQLIKLWKIPPKESKSLGKFNFTTVFQQQNWKNLNCH